MTLVSDAECFVFQKHHLSMEQARCFPHVRRITSPSQVVMSSLSQYDVENGRSACGCICLEAAVSILRQLSDGEWTGSADDVTV